MKGRAGMIDQLCFAAEGMSGTAASAALRKVRSLSELAPSGRMFAAIATLAEASSGARQSLEAAGKAMSKGHDDAAAVRLAGALGHMSKLASASIPELGVKADPKYLRKKR